MCQEASSSVKFLIAATFYHGVSMWNKDISDILVSSSNI